LPSNDFLNFLQVYYGKGIRGNKGDIPGMQKATQAILKHYTDPPNHEDCPDGESSWCLKKRDAATGQHQYLPPKHPLAPAVVTVLKPVFDDLSRSTLLAGCVNCYTQNQNESFHHLLWSILPKDQFHSPGYGCCHLQQRSIYIW
jgi:hypothetical protein